MKIAHAHAWPLVVLVAAACSTQATPPGATPDGDGGVATVDAAPPQDAIAPPSDAGSPQDASDATGPAVVRCGGVDCRGINFVPCCGRSGRCGEFNPFVQKCFEFDAPGTLALECERFDPPQGGLPYPGCCRSDDGLCGHYVAFHSAGRVYSYGCAHPAEFNLQEERYTPTVRCPSDPCPTILFDVATLDPAFSRRVVADLPPPIGAPREGGVGPARRLLVDLRTAPPLETNLDLGSRAPEAEANANFATCTVCTRVVETGPAGETVFFQEAGGFRATRYVEGNDGGVPRIEAIKAKLYGRMIEYETDSNGNPLRPKPGGRCLYLHGFLPVNTN